MEKKGRTALTSGVWAEALDHDDELAIDLIDRAVAALGAGIASAVNLLDVEAVVIGGGLGTRLGEPYVEPASSSRCSRTCSSTRGRRPCTWPPWATWAARSAPPCSSSLNKRGQTPCIQGGQCFARKSMTRSSRSMRRSGRAVAIITWCSSG